MGRRDQIRASRRRAAARVLVVAFSAAVLALVALPTGATAHPRVPPPACPPELTLQAIERAPGGVILRGTVTGVTAATGRLTLAVDAWYHRSPVRGIAGGIHPESLRVDLGRDLAVAATVPTAGVPQAGTRVLVAGTWASAWQGVSVACGVLAGLGSPAGRAWLERVDARYAAFAPSSGAERPRLPLDAPWFGLGMTALALLLAAALLSAVADVRDPLPAT